MWMKPSNGECGLEVQEQGKTYMSELDAKPSFRPAAQRPNLQQKVHIGQFERFLKASA
jgi:hypothetical protein